MCNLSWTPHSNLEKDNCLKTTPVLAQIYFYPLPDPDVGTRFLSLHVMLTILLSILVCAAASLSCRVWSMSRYLPLAIPEHVQALNRSLSQMSEV